jgi:hypothetical protein
MRALEKVTTLVSSYKEFETKKVDAANRVASYEALEKEYNDSLANLK